MEDSHLLQRSWERILEGKKVTIILCFVRVAILNVTVYTEPCMVSSFPRLQKGAIILIGHSKYKDTSDS